MGMTNKEETLDWLYRLKSEIFVFMPKDWLIPFADALDVAIKALEQEPTTKIEESNFSQEQYLSDIQSAYDCGKSILDKIRAEIDSHCSDNRDRNDGLYIAMKIIDKHKAESEPQESEEE